MGELLPVLLVVGLGAGYLLGVRDRRAAVSRAYSEVLPVLHATRVLLTEEPLSPAFPAARAIARHELDQYETRVRAL